MLRQLALLAHRLEDKIGVDRVAREPCRRRVAKPYLINARFNLKLPAIASVPRILSLDTVFRLRMSDDVKLGMARQHLVMYSADPMLAGTNLSVRYRRQVLSKRLSEPLEDIWDRVERDTTYQ